MITATKEFVFEAAHKLENGYIGACANMHGHSYRLQVTVTGELDSMGMVMDFKNLKQIWKDNLESQFDHAVLNETLPFQTTAENMVEHIAGQFKMLVPTHITVLKVRLWETEKSFATWINKSDNNSFAK